MLASSLSIGRSVTLQAMIGSSKRTHLSKLCIIKQFNVSSERCHCSWQSSRCSVSDLSNAYHRHIHSSAARFGGGPRDFKLKRYSKEWKEAQKRKPPIKRKSKASSKKKSKPKPSNQQQQRQFNKLTKEQQQSAPKEVPPAFLARTASPHAYIAKSAIMNEQTGELYVDPMALYSELFINNSNDPSLPSKKRNIIPHIFRQSHLQYFSPANFPNHEPPTDGTPEVAFLGRSNTGKSSLINALHSLILRSSNVVSKNTSSGGGELARTSKTPGRTQTINYFGLVSNTSTSSNNSSPVAKLFLVDLPGFGFASAPDENVDEWQKRTQQFLLSRTTLSETQEENEEQRSTTIQPWPSTTPKKSKTNKRNTILKNAITSPPLKRLYLLLDSRLPEPQHLDLIVMGWCDDYSIPYTVVLTKVDGTSRAHCVKLTNQLCMRYHSLLMDQTAQEEDDMVYMDPVVYWTSAKDGLGMEELLSSVEGCLMDGDEEVGDVCDSSVGDGIDDDEDSDSQDDDSDFEDEVGENKVKTT